jgi:nitrogenase molybdenum-cofactor synthesis protein NifE
MAISLDRLLADGCNADAKHKVCRSRGGESCAFDGAAIVLMPIADAAHVVHGPIGCAANAWEGRGVHSTAGDLHRRGFTTDVGELDIVYGGEGRLEQTVREVVQAERPAAVFVYSTCVTGLIGEDVDAACKRLSAELWIPVIPVNAPGFVGPKNLGNRIAGEVLLEHIIGTGEPFCTTPTDITLIGEYNVAGDLDFVEPLLRESGIRVLSRITGNARFEEIRYAHRAKVSAVVCSRALVNVASSLVRRYGMPSVEVSFFGATETARSLRTIAAAIESVAPAAAASGLLERVETVIARREQRLAQDLAPYSALRGKRAVLYSGGVKSWSMASALIDLGIEVIAVGTKKSSAEDEEKVRRVLGHDVPLIESISPAVIRRLFAENGADLLVAGGRNRYLAAKEGWPFIDVNQEREHAYAGYEGLVQLAHDLHESVRFYEAQGAVAAECPSAKEPTPISTKQRVSAIDPLKNAPSVGAALALQGVDAALPVLHGAQGCSFLGKVLMIRHFNEPIALATSSLFTEEVVLGSDQAAESVVGTFATKADGERPDIVALIGGGLSEVKGDDVAAVARRLDAEHAPAVIAVSAPDYEGGLEEGYAAAVAALAALADDRAPADSRCVDGDRHRITVLAGAHLTPGDVTWLRETCEDFGLDPTILPDLGALDGSRQGLSPLASGGTPLSRIRRLGTSAHTLVLGASLEPVARSLRERFGTPYTVLDSVHGLAATDLLLAKLSLLASMPAPARHERQRSVLVDAMRDAHLELAGARVTLALEPDHALSLAPLFAEVAAETSAVLPTSPAHAARIAATAVVVGDFASIDAATELLVSNSHGARTAEHRRAALLETGFPVFSSYGAARAVTLGYAGATALVDAAANELAARERAHRPPAPPVPKHPTLKGELP